VQHGTLPQQPAQGCLGQESGQPSLSLSVPLDLLGLGCPERRIPDRIAQARAVVPKVEPPEQGSQARGRLPTQPVNPPFGSSDVTEPAVRGFEGELQGFPVLCSHFREQLIRLGLLFPRGLL